MVVMRFVQVLNGSRWVLDLDIAGFGVFAGVILLCLEVFLGFSMCLFCHA